MQVAISREPHAADLPLPEYATAGSSGLDLSAAISEPITLAPGSRAAIPTGLRIAVPEGWEAQARPRSGLALRQGLGMVNAPGTIDSDYRGEIFVILINHGEQPIVLHRGDRVAQLVFAPVTRITWKAVTADDLTDTVRGSGGFGHTGVSRAGDKP